MRIFSRYVWRFSLDKKEIYLTFDDGPTPEITQFVLDELKKHNAKATFFCIGKNILKHPNIFKKVNSEGHSIGNHTQNHANGWQTKSTKYFDDFLECEDAILTALGETFEKSQKQRDKKEERRNKGQETANKMHEAKLFRPPYGKLKKRQAKEILKRGYKIIMWDVLSADFDTTISNEKCLQNILNNTKNGSIIVFHDSAKAAEKVTFVLPLILKKFSKKGFVFRAI
jgi:peptidoglycan/xylan/chitin deacetylase (PgdA/CDA1 family)